MTKTICWQIEFKLKVNLAFSGPVILLMTGCLLFVTESETVSSASSNPFNPFCRKFIQGLYENVRMFYLWGNDVWVCQLHLFSIFLCWYSVYTLQ